MTTRPRGRSRLARKLSWLAVASLTLTALLAPGAAGTALAKHGSLPNEAPNADRHELVDGNPKCGEGQYGTVKINVPAPSEKEPNPQLVDGTYDNTIVISNATRYSFDWAFTEYGLHTYDMDAVIVKGGPNANVYYYDDVTDDSDDAAITAAIVAMARTLGLKTIAEGVETDAQLRFLKSLGCDEGQGYYFSRPLPPEALADFVRKRSVA